MRCTTEGNGRPRMNENVVRLWMTRAAAPVVNPRFSDESAITQLRSTAVSTSGCAPAQPSLSHEVTGLRQPRCTYRPLAPAASPLPCWHRCARGSDTCPVPMLPPSRCGLAPGRVLWRNRSLVAPRVLDGHHRASGHEGRSRMARESKHPDPVRRQAATIARRRLGSWLAPSGGGRRGLEGTRMRVR
jgi:hypothetical protein